MVRIHILRQFYSSLIKITLLLFNLFLLTSCLESKNLAGSAGDTNLPTLDSFLGCVDGSGLDGTRISVNFEFPTFASRMSVYRNGLRVYSSTNKSNTNFVDSGLQEGGTYEYTCEAEKNGITALGSRSLTVSTVSTNAPQFTGIVTATALTSRSARVTWGIPSSNGPVASTFKIYMNPGTTVNWGGVAKATLSAGTYSYNVTGLGDELPYSVGVRACTSSNYCDGNVAEIDLNLADGGAPLTTGATGVTAVNGVATITVPWVESLGAVYKRKVYRRVGAVGGTVLANYTLVKTEVVSNLARPITSIDTPGCADSTTYHFIVQDEDPSLQSNDNLNVISLSTGDLTPPTFGGITSLALGAPADANVTANFTAIDREGTGDPGATTGTSYYRLYKTSALFPSLPTNSCTTGAQLGSDISAAGYAPGARSISISSLSPRTTYSFCLKAIDAAGNISTNTGDIQITTLDVTPPTFDGVQTIVFNGATTKINVSWNVSPASDTSTYRLKVWKNTSTPIAGDITTLNLVSGSWPTGYAVSTSDFSFTNLDVVYALVDACDNANILPGGAQNCTSYSIAAAMSVTLPNFEPPLGFPGIKTPASQTSSVEGEMTVSWFPPAGWTAVYTGFKVYNVNPATQALTLLKNCPCAIPGSCTTVSDTSCTLTGLSPYRNYRFHVRAYNSSGFETTYLDPAVNYADKRVLDTTSPAFNSGLTIGVAPNYQLNWASATDNQYNGDANTITYNIYRKVTTTFATPVNPSADGTLVGSTTSLNFIDSGWVAGTTYYYAVCARDSSNNSSCDGVVKSMTATDTIPPSLTSFTSDKSTAMKKWGISWNMADTGTINANLHVKIYESVTASAANATTSDNLILDSYGDTNMVGLTGPINVNKYINYLLWVQDQAGNIATANLSVNSTNTITVTSAQKNQGLVAGGRTVLINGTGFSKGTDNGFGTDTVVKMDGTSCTTSTYVSQVIAICKTPAHAAGLVTVSVHNPDGSSSSLNMGYEYLASSLDICDNPGSWVANGMAAGSGTALDPFILCTPTHLDNLKKNIADGASSNFRTGGFSFKLGDNIDLLGFPLVPLPTSDPTLDGNSMAIMNWTYTGSGNVGLFASVSSANIKNLFLFNFSITTNGTNPRAGMLIGNAGGMSVLQNVSAIGTVLSSATGSGSVGGLIGTSAGGLVMTTVKVVGNVTNTAGTTIYSGGVVGNNTSTGDWTSISFDGNVTSNIAYVGGITGSGTYNGSLKYSYVKGNVTGASYVGGLFGTGTWCCGVWSKVDQSFFQGTVTASANPAGALAGSGYDYAYDSYFIATLYGASGVFRCVLDGWYSGATEKVFAVVAVQSAMSTSGLVSWPASGCAAGGPCFVNTTTLTPFTYGVQTNVTNQSTTQMQNQATNSYAAAGWDFTPVTGKWKWCGASDYPHLMWETCP